MLEAIAPVRAHSQSLAQPLSLGSPADRAKSAHEDRLVFGQFFKEMGQSKHQAMESCLLDTLA